MQARIAADRDQRALRELQRRMPPLLDSVVAAGPARGRFLDLSRLFDGDTSLVYLDLIGHTTPHAAARVADTLAGALLPLLGEPGCAATGR